MYLYGEYILGDSCGKDGILNQGNQTVAIICARGKRTSHKKKKVEL